MIEFEERENDWKRNFPHVYDEMNFFRYMTGSKSHLDFGCGFGTFVYMLARKHPETLFYGEDIDPETISKAKKSYTLRNLKFSPRNKTKYDSISSLYVLHHVKNTERALKKLYSRLNKGGKILILEFQKTGKKKFLELYGVRYHSDDFDEYYAVHNRWTKTEFREMCERAGFKTILQKNYGDYWFVYIGEKE